jgi:hypothetical protein
MHDILFFYIEFFTSYLGTKYDKLFIYSYKHSRTNKK